MGEVTIPKPVKLIMGAIYRENSIWEETKVKLQGLWGPIDYLSPEFPFTHTRYYEPEMGPALSRRYFAFDKLIDPGQIVSIKLTTNEIEQASSTEEGKRQINLDPGYIELSKLVLASTKNFSHRIYLGKGIYGELTLSFSKGTFFPHNWTFPDYREYTHIFTEIRTIYYHQLREQEL